MATKTKNDPSQYLTRSALAGPSLNLKEDKPRRSTASARTEAEQRDAKGTLDNRWYIKLPPKR